RVRRADRGAPRRRGLPDRHRPRARARARPARARSARTSLDGHAAAQSPRLGAEREAAFGIADPAAVLVADGVALLGVERRAEVARRPDAALEGVPELVEALVAGGNLEGRRSHVLEPGPTPELGEPLERGNLERLARCGG